MPKIDSLYEIAAELDTLMWQADLYAAEHDGVIPDDLADKIDALEMQKDVKIGNVARYIKNLKAEADMVDAEAKRLAARKKSAENKADYLKTYLAAILAEGNKYKDESVAISWRKSTATVIDNLDAVPDEYCKIERKAMASEIKAAISEGREVTGAHIEERQNIQIK